MTDGPRVVGQTLTLPTPPRDPGGAEAQTLRGQADRMALRLANHDEGLNARLRPADASAAEVFDAVEQTRIEAVGSASLKGVRDNMNAALVSRLHRMGAAASGSCGSGASSPGSSEASSPRPSPGSRSSARSTSFRAVPHAA